LGEEEEFIVGDTPFPLRPGSPPNPLSGGLSTFLIFIQ